MNYVSVHPSGRLALSVSKDKTLRLLLFILLVQYACPSQSCTLSRMLLEVMCIPLHTERQCGVKFLVKGKKAVKCRVFIVQIGVAGEY